MPSESDNNAVASYEVTDEQVKEVRQLVAGIKELAGYDFDDMFIKKFLHARNGDPKSAAHRMKGYFQMRRNYPQGFMLVSEVFETFHPPLFTTQDEVGMEGEPIVYIKISLWDYTKHDLNFAFSAITPFSEVASMQDGSPAQRVGFTILVDMRDWTWSHMWKLRPGQLKTCFVLGEESMPTKFRRMHVLFNNKIVSAFFAIARPFMSDELVKSIVFHGSDLSKLYEEIPKSKLPEAIGGECKPKVLTQEEIELGDKTLTELWNKYPAKIVPQ
ncbi:Retinaldehyde-binding protein 1 [Halotydeus destructor]|nr:Retinaldehyde-binding protein 1 [Halotydeus destructor]